MSSSFEYGEGVDVSMLSAFRVASSSSKYIIHIIGIEQLFERCMTFEITGSSG